LKYTTYIENKIVTLAQLQSKIAAQKLLNKTVVFTNGCFDILHVGHLFSISNAAQEGDFLIVAINSDASVKLLNKAPNRPINNENDRSKLIAAFALVDAVIIFDEETPETLIHTILPNVLVKGGDYTIETIVGSKAVIANGGRVVINKIVEGYSTTNTVSKM
jgi:D-glycero-beta-D-manno-heptose 1-phosphate adenylyltransferase